MNAEPDDAAEDPFNDFEDMLAAQARQLFRAMSAYDAKAVETTLFYFRAFLVKVLARHLRDDSNWPSEERWLDGLGVSEPGIIFPNYLRIRDYLVWATRDQESWYIDPFEFELELFPLIGSFRCYTFRFGDHRPLDIKKLSPSSTVVTDTDRDDKGWVFVFNRSRCNCGEERREERDRDSIEPL